MCQNCQFATDPALGWNTKDFHHPDTADLHNDPNSRIIIDLCHGNADVTVDSAPAMHLDNYMICHGHVEVTGDTGSAIHYKEIP